MTAVRYGPYMHNSGPLASPAVIRDLAVEAERRGYDGVWANGHVLPAHEPDYHWPIKGSYIPHYGVQSTLAYVAALTRRVRLGSSVQVAAEGATIMTDIREQPAAGAAGAGAAAGPTRRRLLAGALSAGVAGPLSACEPVGGAKTAEVEGRVTLWYLNQFRFDTGIGGEIVKETMAQHPKLQVVPEEISGDRVEKLKVAAAAGSAPDIGQAGSWQMQEFGAAGIAKPVDGYLKTSKVVKQSDIWPTLLYDLTWKSQQYGMPFGPDIAVLWVQANLVRSVGLDPSAPPQTWDQLEQHIGRLYQPDPPRIGYHPLQGSGGARAMFLLAFSQVGGQLLSADGTKVTINNELGLRALEWITKVCNAQGGYAAIQAATNNGNIAAGFANGTVAYMFESSDQQVRDVFKNATALQYTVATAPIPPGGRRASVGGCHSFCITTQSKAPDGAWKFLETLSSEKNNLEFALQFNRIPIRVATARSAAFHQNDPIKKLAGEQMEHRRWLIPAPGGTEAAALYNTLGPDVATGKVAARDALAETERQIQQALDKWKR